MTVSPFVSVGFPHGNKPTDFFSLQKSDVWRYVLHRARINADVRNSQLPDIAYAGIDNFTELWIRHRNCHLGLNSSSQRRPAIGIETRTHVAEHEPTPRRP